ncbi:unnamed protein product [Adineta steineri]|uniref:NAD(P)(+)--arginine ADP-ribosyltransferase n=1 Tax=Adineta steineri TaxID=433720 RepID=A0A819XN38_9BILA|nr:unnamed protein product [Adineta steineri]
MGLEQADDTKSNRLFRLLLSMGDLPRAYLFLYPPNSNKTIAAVVEDAAEGIIKEGTFVGKAIEACWLAKMLLDVKDSGKNCMLCSETTNIPAEIGQTSNTLYTMESYLFEELNKFMRNFSGMSMQQVFSYGPFCYLLQSYLHEISSISQTTVYRGIELSDEQRQDFMKEKVIFSSFTSTSKNRKRAELSGNTLLIIKFNADPFGVSEMAYCGSDIELLSFFPEEEEFLIRPPAVFRFVKHDIENNKHIIYLERSRHNIFAVLDRIKAIRYWVMSEWTYKDDPEGWPQCIPFDNCVAQNGVHYHSRWKMQYTVR